MAARVHFLGWDRPVTAGLTEFLMPEDPDGPVDFGDRLIVTPTRQAGRRLREALAVRCSRRKTAVLGARVVTPAALLHPDKEPPNTACRTDIRELWAEVLLGSDAGPCEGLFPEGVQDRDFSWAIRSAEMIQGLRVELAGDVHRLVVE